MADFPDICPDDETLGLEANNQIFNSVLTGQTQTAQLTGDKWSAQPSFSNRNGDEARELRGFIFGLGGARGRFNYSPFSIDQGGTMSGNGVVDGADQTGSVLNTKGWDAGQTELFKVGDYLSFNGELKMITGDVDNSSGTYIEYDGTNEMPSPFDPEGWWGATTDPDGTITNATMPNPSGQSFVGLAEQTGALSQYFILTSTPSYSGIRGEIGATSLLVKSIPSSDPFVITLRLDDTGSEPAKDTRFSTIDWQPVANGNDEFRVIPLDDDFYLIQAKSEQLFEANIYSQSIFMEPNGASADIGSKCYVQAAFFGKNPNTYPYALYNEFEDASEAGEFNVSGTSLSISGGELFNTGNTSSSSHFSKTALFDSSKISKMIIRWRRIAGVRPLEFRFNSSIYGASSIYVYNETTLTQYVSTIQDGSYYITTFDFSSNPEWVGDITYQRWDVGDIGDEFAFDSIKIYSPSLLQAYEDWWPASVLANAQIPIAPPIRVSPADNNAIETTKPFFVGRLEDDDQARVSVSSPIIYNATFSIVEAF